MLPAKRKAVKLQYSPACSAAPCFFISGALFFNFVEFNFTLIYNFLTSIPAALKSSGAGTQPGLPAGRKISGSATPAPVLKFGAQAGLERVSQ